MDPSLENDDADTRETPVYLYASANPTNMVDPSGLEADVGSIRAGFEGFNGVSAAPSFTQAIAAARAAATGGKVQAFCKTLVGTYEPCVGGVGSLPDELQRALFYIALTPRGQAWEDVVAIPNSRDSAPMGSFP
jgi:hypothetical protein